MLPPIVANLTQTFAHANLSDAMTILTGLYNRGEMDYLPSDASYESLARMENLMKRAEVVLSSVSLQS